MYLEPVQAGCADVALVQSDVVCGVGGVSVPQTDIPVPAEVLTKPQAPTALRGHFNQTRFSTFSGTTPKTLK